MTLSEWATIKHFKAVEFNSHDKLGTGMAMQFAFVQKLDSLREKFGKPILVMSGMRTPEHNAEVGGVNESAHIGGWASDITCMFSRDRYELLRLIFTEGLFRRVGVGKSFIHVDCDPTKPQDVVWLY